MRGLATSVFITGWLWAATAPGGISDELPLVHSLFTDHMVLQRDVACPVWGWSEPDDTVTVTFNGQTKTATAAADGRWEVLLDPMPTATEPQTLSVQSPIANHQSSITDVLVGDVWLCSGQSNMEMGLNGVDQWWNELPHGSLPLLRLFWVKPNSTPERAKTVTGKWVVADDGALLHMKAPYTSIGFSAIAYFFGRAVQRETGIPIGIVESDQGNTAIDPWSTVESLQKVARYKDLVTPWACLEKRIEDGLTETDPHYDASTSWRGPEFDDAAWPVLDLPVEYRACELKGWDGFVWFRRDVELPADWSGRPLDLHLSPVYGQETTWFNGVFVGAQDGKWQEHRFSVPGELVKAGRNMIAVRVLDSFGFTGKADDMRLGLADGGADPMALAGPWRYQRGTAKADLTGRKYQFHRIWMPSGLYNGMIAALVPFGIKGVTWYQGEGNVGYARTYYDELARMITDWRATFGQDQMPFYIVQLANFGPLPAEPVVGSGWATVREAQWRVSRDVPHTGLAVAIDRGEIRNIHPPNKREVGERLAAVALARTYGQDIPCEGPAYRDMTVEGDKVRIRFDHATGLKSVGAAPAGFAVAGADQRWVWAQARIDGETVLVWSPDIPAPVAVRYGWGDNAVCNLYNEANFPAVPFRTDSW